MPRDKNTPLSQPVFSEDQITPDPTHFEVGHDAQRDNQLYDEIRKLHETKDVVSFDKMRGNPDDLFTLESALGAAGAGIVDEIRKAKQITFHSGGDTGASTDTKGKYRNEITVADQMTDDCRSNDPKIRPRFFYHLGDTVYNFCEPEYWYDQFYEPYRNYPGPIFAIPGNHDSFITHGTPAASYPLVTFSRNFCAETPNITTEARSLHRTAMTQPGVYFALDAPFVRIIGLFSNSLEDPGVISNQSKRWHVVPNFQLEFLQAQLERIKKESYKGAVLLAVHHPPFTYSPKKQGRSGGGNHGSSTEMLHEIDEICDKIGIYPHAFLSGHAHNYQRFARTINFKGKEYEIPFIVCGDAGHNVNPIVHNTNGQHVPEPHFDTDVRYLDVNHAVDSKDLKLKKYADNHTSYGYLRITVSETQIGIGFHLVGISSLAQSRFDLVTVNIESHRLVAN